MSNSIPIIFWRDCDPQQQQQQLQRPAITASATISHAVTEIIHQVTTQGDEALRTLSAKFDHVALSSLAIPPKLIEQAADTLTDDLKQAMQQAMANIKKFHTAQRLPDVDIDTMPGVRCQQVTRPISSVGLYIPGGSAPLFSTVLMLGVPALVAGCQRVVLCSPPPISNEILYAASLCGIQQIYQVGGAQAIAAMAFGTESIPRVDKIFGPGNAYVTEAKRRVSQSLDGAAIDMPAGPSEVLVIADDSATPAFIAADLLSQAEHGPDSQVILLTPHEKIAREVAQAMAQQLTALPRADIVRQALQSSRLIVATSMEECINISNRYGPEHLIIQTIHPRQWIEQISNAGSVFLGEWSPEAVGDYASGTNHVLPTYGYTNTYSSLGLADFQKRMTIQQLSSNGLLHLAPLVTTMAQAEHLTAHKNAVTLRLAALKERQNEH